jgi:hypothetical protein
MVDSTSNATTPALSAIYPDDPFQTFGLPYTCTCDDLYDAYLAKLEEAQERVASLAADKMHENDLVGAKERVQRLKDCYALVQSTQ